jgi:hypothetical protein
MGQNGVRLIYMEDEGGKLIAFPQLRRTFGMGPEAPSGQGQIGGLPGNQIELVEIDPLGVSDWPFYGWHLASWHSRHGTFLAEALVICILTVHRSSLIYELAHSAGEKPYTNFYLKSTG